MTAMPFLTSLLLAAALLVAAAPGASAATTSQRDRAVRWAVSQNGHKEIASTNRSPRIDDWLRDMSLPLGRPWCGALVHQAFLRAGVRLSKRLIDPYLSYQDAVAGRRGLKRIPLGKVRRGDLLFFAFSDGPRASHLAIARSRARNGSIPTIEGNVGNTVRRTARGSQYPVLAARVTRR